MPVPPFDLQGGAALVLARGTAVAGLLSAAGALAFRSLVLPRALAQADAGLGTHVERRLLLLVQASVAVCAAAMLAWLAIEAGQMAEAANPAAALAAVPAVLRTTSFGHVLLGQIGCLVLVAALVRRPGGVWRRRAALAAAGAALCLQAGHSHAASMQPGPSVLLGADVLHLMGAAGWLGGLLPLLMVVRLAPPRVAARAARWFSPLGQVCVGALVVSAAVQGWVLVGSVPGLVGTAYGWMVLGKLALSAVLLGFAAANRYRFAPALLGRDPVQARRVLTASIAWQSGAALAIIVAAVVLSDLPPAMHLQPLWPFSKLIDLEAVREDADFRREAILAGAALAGGLLVLATAFAMRRWRLPAAGLAGLVAWFAVPHLDVLLADATPTSFYHSPTGFSADSIVAGAALFAQNCTACHGANGAGDGVLARTLAVPPANLLAAHVLMHDDGEMFGWMTNGIRTPEGVQVMPGMAPRLSEDQRWALIDYVRAHNLGAARQAGGVWPVPAQAPGFQARCGTQDIDARSPRDEILRLVIGPAPQAGANGVVAVGTQAGPPDACVAADEAVAAAYAIIAGVPSGALGGAEFLIDGQGWLRAYQAPGAAIGWANPAVLDAAMAALHRHKVAQAPMAMHMEPDMKM